MKEFDQWFSASPLAGERLTERDRTMLKIAYLGGASAAIDEHQASLDRLAASRTATEA